MKDIEQIQIIWKLPFPLLIEDSIDENWRFLDDKFIQINNDENTIASWFYFRKVINKNQDWFIIAVEDFYWEFSYTQFCLIFRKKHTINNDLNFFIQTIENLLIMKSF